MQKMSKVRLIAGRFRGHHVWFSNHCAIRPTRNMVRETLFNWLKDAVPGAHCLDLYAGSGALGFEALSRGAQNVVFVDKNPLAIQMIQANCNRLGLMAHEATAWCRLSHLALSALGHRKQSFDLIFLDPPFSMKSSLIKTMDQVHALGCLAQHGFLYVETLKTQDSAFPPQWRCWRSCVQGQVRYGLYVQDLEHPVELGS